MTQPRGLWPEKAHLKGYIDQWAKAYETLDRESQVAIETYQKQCTDLQTQVSQLKDQVASQARPLQETIVELQHQLIQAQARIKSLEAEEQRTTERLATAIEVPATASWIDRDAIITQTIFLIEESKQMVRENL